LTVIRAFEIIISTPHTAGVDMKSILLITLLMISSISFVHAQPSVQQSIAAKEEESPKALAVDSACMQEAATASCGNAKVSTGLLRCIRSYKQANKDFKPSDSCRRAIRKLHADRKATEQDLIRE
jgi:hypothetical protein